MSKYIDIDKIISHLKDEMEGYAYGMYETYDIHQVEYGTYRGLLSAKSLVETAETADVVKVTRCKDCKFYEPYDKPPEDFDGRCFARNCETDEYDFCNYGCEKGDKKR